MKAVFLVGGLGTRLRPLTNKTPKPLVPVMGKALLEHNIDKLKFKGVDEIVLCTCYRPESFEEYFSENPSALPIRFVQEKTPLGTGGAIKNVEGFISDEPFLIFNADIISDVDVAEMLRFHEEKGADVTIASVYVDDPTPYGVIEHDENDYATAFKEKPKPSEVVSHYINAGIYIFNPEILEEIPAGRPVSVEREVFPRLLKGGKKLAVYKECSYWLDLGTVEKYLQVHQDIFAGKYLYEQLDFRNSAIIGLENAHVHAEAILRGPLWLGAGAQIEKGAVVGPNVIVGANSVVGEDCTIEHSILWESVKVEAASRIFDSVIMANCLVEEGSTVFRSAYSGEVPKDYAAV